MIASRTVITNRPPQEPASASVSTSRADLYSIGQRTSGILATG